MNFLRSLESLKVYYKDAESQSGVGDERRHIFFKFWSQNRLGSEAGVGVEKN